MSLSRHTLLSVIVLVSVNAKADGNECDKVANDPAAVAACHADNIPNTDYVYAGNGLDAFDCTGLTKYAYGRFGTDLARGTTGQANEGVPVAEPYQRGDIIIFDARVPGDHPKCKVDEPPAFCANPYDPLHLQASHAGIYEGENKFIHANAEQYGVERQDLDGRGGNANMWSGVSWKERVIAVRRLPPPPGPSKKFVLGDLVELTQEASVRTDPLGLDTYESKTPTQSPPAKGRIDYPPVLSNGNWRWRVDFESGVDGWVAEEFLKPAGGGGGGSMRIEDVPFEDADLRQCVLAQASHWGWKTADDVLYVYCWDGYAVEDLSWDGVSSLQGMEYFPNLIDLKVYGGSITSLAPLTGLRKLTYLVLPDYNISDLNPIKSLTALEIIEMPDNNISDLQPLSGIKNLRSLALNNNNISDLGPLAGLTNLTNLLLSQNQISDLRPLAGLTKLIDLELGENEIADLSPLTKLVTLNWLNLGGNQITNVGPLFNLTKLIALNLWGNNGIRCDELDALKSALTALEDGRWGRPASCVTSVNGMCGPINGSQCSSSLSSSSWGLCNAGTVTEFRFSSGRWLWTCAGSGGGTSASCSETRCSTTTTVNGVCGALVGDGFCSTGLTASSPGLCSKGTVSSFLTLSALYAWNCLGQNGGSDTTCFDYRCD